MDDNSLDRLFAGDLDKLVPLPRRVVRIFMSSTFTDMTLERNSFMERTYPRLKKYCREKHGLDFQVVDMRWGVRDEATDDHQTVTLCSREIDTCQRVSVGPNFVALIGDKYGFRPLLNRIKSTEYRALRRCLIEVDVNTDFLDTWYKEDLNSVPAEYLLQPISSILKNFTNKNEPELQSVDQRIWSAIQDRLHELLMIGSSHLVKQGRMSEREQLMKYSISVTEREVIEGCLDVNEAKLHCLVYIRSIVDIREHLDRCLAGLMEDSGPSSPHQLDTNSPSDGVNQARRRKSSGGGGEARKASLKIGDDSVTLATSNARTAAERRVEKTRRLIGRYVDIKSTGDGHWQLDEEAQAALRNLKFNKLASKMSPSSKNLTMFEINWNEQDGLTAKSEQHKQYLAELTEHFYTNLTNMIKKASKSESAQVKSGLIGEVLQHSHYAKHVSKTFHGRKLELEKVRTYIALDHQPLPMLLYGVNGSGKSSLMARVATQAKFWASSSTANLKQQRPLGSNANGSTINMDDETQWDRKPCIIMRFCRTTPSSSSMVGLLSSVCRQLQYNFYQYGPLNGMMNQPSSTSATTGGDSFHQQNQQLPNQRVPGDFMRLVFTFRQLLDNCRHHYHERRNFIIILDSIDRLTSPAECSIEAKYSWLTSINRLPRNVRLLVSCSSESSSSTSTSDFLYLKRHFLQANFRLRQMFRSSGSSGRLSSIGSLASEKDPKDEPTYNPSQQTSAARDSSSEGSLQFTRRSSGKNSIDRYRFVRRVIVPAMRLMRSKTRDITENNNGGAKLNLKGPTLLIRRASDLTGDARLSVGSRNSSIDYFHPKNFKKQSEQIWILHVKPMGVKLAQNVLQRWLSDHRRTLTQQQWKIVESSLNHCSRPIFVKLAFGEVINWKSYSAQSDAKGLTFGSALLAATEDEPPMIRAGGEDRLSEALRQLTERVNAKEQDDEFIWQILSMEQQWGNYLNYKQQQSLRFASKKATKRASKDEKSGESEESGAKSSLVIRVGAQSSGGASGTSGVGSNSISASPICRLSSTIEDAICQLFARIEMQHGFILTKHCLSYITAARNGICENELEDILSLDDVVLDDVFQYHLPPVRRIPPLLWTRIRSDLPDYLSERDADGMIVIDWHHSQFQQVTMSRYLDDSKQCVYIHSILADYFLGKWADRAKPFRCTKQQIQMAAEQLESAVQQSIRESTSAGSRVSLSGGRLRNESIGVRSGASFSLRNRLRSSDQHDQRLQWIQAKADRRVPHQPLFFTDTSDTHQVTVSEMSDGNFDVRAKNSTSATDMMTSLDRHKQQKRRYNLRKLTELPYHMMRCNRFEDLASCVLFNYKWLLAALDSIGLQLLWADYNEARNQLAEMLKQMESEKIDGEKDTLTNLPRNKVTYDEPATGEQRMSLQAIRSMISQIDIIGNTLRLSSSSLHSDTQMLAPQLLGRLLHLVANPRSMTVKRPTQINSKSLVPYQYIDQLLDQCDKDGCYDCSLLPADHCLQSPDGLQLSSLEGHSFAVMSMAMAADQRHLLGASSKFIMWDISTGEIARDIDPKIAGSIIMELKLSLDNKYAVAYTTDRVVLVVEILTQQVVKFDEFGWNLAAANSQEEKFLGINLIDRLGALKFLVWTSKRWFVLSITAEADQVTVDHDREEPMMNLRSETHSFKVQLEYSIELDDFLPLGHRYAITSVDYEYELLGSRVDDRKDLCFVCVTIDNSDTYQETSHLRESLELLTLDLRYESDDIWHPSVRLWPKSLPNVVSMKLNHSLTQLIFANSIGEVYLSRRRRTAWSRPKLIRSHKVDNSGADDLSSIISSMKSRATYSTVQTIELDSHLNPDEEFDRLSVSNESERIQLSNLETQVDSLESGEEIKATRSFSITEGDHKNDYSEAIKAGEFSAPIKLVVLYLSDRITVLKMDGSETKEWEFLLPRDTRNVCIEPNKSQIRSQLVGHNYKYEYFVVASGKKLIFYSTNTQQIIKSIEGHAGRILQLLQISLNSEGSKLNSQPSLCFASASIDKTVKIWNLNNLEKNTKSIERLGGPIDYVCIAPQRPLVACLTRNELGIYNWRTIKLLARFTYPQLMSLVASEQTIRGVPQISCCRFSSNARYLCLATGNSVHLFALEGLKNPVGESVLRSSVASSSSKVSSSRQNEDQIDLKGIFSRCLPAYGIIRKILFLMQDSRLLVFLDCLNDSGKRDSNSTDLTRETGTTSSRVTSEHLLRRVVVVCYSVPDGRPIYCIDCSTPIVSNTGGAQYFASSQTSTNRDINGGERDDRSSAGPRQKRLPVLTRDHLHIVCAEFSRNLQAAAEARGSPERRRTSALVKFPLDLNVYSTRDGGLIRSIALNQLSRAEIPVPSEPRSSSYRDSISSTNSSSLIASGSVDLKNKPTAAAFKPQNDLVGARKQVSITGDQFTRLKSISYLDRQSVVALLDDDKGSSFLIDVQTEQLLATSNTWNGKVAFDGRFGLSRIFKSANFKTGGSTIQRDQNGGGGGGGVFASGGLQLLEMRHCRPVKNLMTLEQLSMLTSQVLGSTGSDSDTIVGFTKPNDMYVFCCNSRLKRLILIRTRDNQMIANYKLSSVVNKVKCSHDGLSLIMGHTDGTLISLAIVDPQQSDTLTRLSQMPSRRRG